MRCIPALNAEAILGEPVLMLPVEDEPSELVVASRRSSLGRLIKPRLEPGELVG